MRRRWTRRRRRRTRSCASGRGGGGAAVATSAERGEPPGSLLAVCEVHHSLELVGWIRGSRNRDCLPPYLRGPNGDQLGVKEPQQRRLLDELLREAAQPPLHLLEAPQPP